MENKIIIVYEEFKANERSVDVQSVSEKDRITTASYKAKNSIKNDVTYGTHKLLVAAECAIQNPSWKYYEPIIKNYPNYRITDSRFELHLSPKQFNIESEGIDHFIGTIAGDILDNSNIEKISVSDFRFPEGMSYIFPGPNLGSDKILELFREPKINHCMHSKDTKLYKDKNQSSDTINRPLVAFSYKPRMGYSISEFETLYKLAAESGVDIIEDDERMIDPIYCPFEERIKIAAKLQETYKHTKFSANITGSLEKAKERLEIAHINGIKFVKIDVLVTGFETLRQIACLIRDRNLEMGITVYPDTKTYRKLSREFILKMSRLCGADIIYAGSPYWSRDLKDYQPIYSAMDELYERHAMLRSEIPWCPNLKRTIPTLTNDFNFNYCELVTAYLKKHYNHTNYAFFIGGGISAFPTTISDAVKITISATEHAVQFDFNSGSKYKPYELDQKTEEKLRSNNWSILDVSGVLK